MSLSVRQSMTNSTTVVTGFVLLIGADNAALA